MSEAAGGAVGAGAHRWFFELRIDLDAQALIRVLQPFAVLGLRPQSLVMSDREGDAFAVAAHYDNLDDDVAARLLARLRQMPCVKIATANVWTDVGSDRAIA